MFFFLIKNVYFSPIGLDVATNKVSTENMGGVPHHLMSFLKPTDSDYSRWHFRNDAIRTIEGVWKRGGLPIVAGGSSWINVLLHCMTMPKREKSPIPGIGM
jgi:tRNA A37 N6-isopentenylltransferase MiaA